MDFSTSINPGGIQTSDTDLSAFYQKGGKLLTYHGGADQVSYRARSLQSFSVPYSNVNIAHAGCTICSDDVVL